MCGKWADISSIKRFGCVGAEEQSAFEYKGNRRTSDRVREQSWGRPQFFFLDTKYSFASVLRMAYS
jgi:hypothetical protein